ncbi:MAG: hypothetical protein JW716_03925 [Candidatus Aenigmarchaeota archaeon]|nr:hypothetical protein [Candidatus Aenigmarchaeota archaeon]
MAELYLHKIPAGTSKRIGGVVYSFKKDFVIQSTSRNIAQSPGSPHYARFTLESGTVIDATGRIPEDCHVYVTGKVFETYRRLSKKKKRAGESPFKMGNEERMDLMELSEIVNEEKVRKKPGIWRLFPVIDF